MSLLNLRGGLLTGYQNFARKFKTGTFVSSEDIAKKADLGKALASLYVFPAFFKKVYYIPTLRERKGHFIEKPSQFFYKLFNFVYGRKKWYWSLTTAARYYGSEWSSTKILEIVVTKESKTIDIASRISSLEKKRSYRSKIMAEIFSSLDTNLVIIHKGKKEFLNEIKIDSETGPVATRKRMEKDFDFFIKRTKSRQLRKLYKKHLK